MKVVILAGGFGTRIGRETKIQPKPMLKIGGKPILWHIMKNYAHFGFKDFVICLGYKGEVIKDYFLNYQAINNDFSVLLNSSKKITFHNSHKENDWQVTLIETGLESQTGARIKKVEKYLDDDLFMLTYGDGIGSVNVKKLLAFHRSHGKIGTVTGVNPSSRFGILNIKYNRVVSFKEKPKKSLGLVNGGFFVFQKDFFKYLKRKDSCVLEKEPLEKLAKDGQLMAYHHPGFWYCVDTFRELEYLNELWQSKNPPWKIWQA